MFKQSTPIALVGVGLSSQGTCRMMTDMTYNISEISDKLDDLKLEEEPGSFSFESSIYRAIVYLDKQPTCFSK